MSSQQQETGVEGALHDVATTDTAGTTAQGASTSPFVGPVIIPPMPHDPRERVVIGCVEQWQILQFAESDVRFAYFRDRGFLHIQLWYPPLGISVLTPSRLTNGRYEMWWNHATRRTSSAQWSELSPLIPDVKTPGATHIAALQRWMFQRCEPKKVALLRAWWSATTLPSGNIELPIQLSDDRSALMGGELQG